MNEQELFAIIGRQHAQNETLLTEYSRLLMVLIGVQQGQIDPACIAIDLPARTWKITPAPEPAETEPVAKIGGGA